MNYCKLVNIYYITTLFIMKINFCELLDILEKIPVNAPEIRDFLHIVPDFIILNLLFFVGFVQHSSFCVALVMLNLVQHLT